MKKLGKGKRPIKNPKQKHSLLQQGVPKYKRTVGKKIP